MIVDDKDMYKLEYFSVVVEDGGKIPVFLTLADSEEEAKEWAGRQRVAMLAAAKEEGAELPFDTAKIQLFDREAFRKLIGIVDLHTAAYAEWYARSLISYLLYRVGEELGFLTEAAISGKLEEVGARSQSVLKCWIHLNQALENCDISPHIETHEPGKDCFGCADIDECPKGQKFLAGLSAVSAPKIWN